MDVKTTPPIGTSGEKVAILLNLDITYLGPSEVAIKSFFSLHPDFRGCEVFIAHLEHDRISKAIFKRFAGIKVHPIPLPIDLVPKEATTPGHFSTANYLRLFAAEFLPKGLTHVIYFDADFLFTSELPDLPQHVRDCNFISAVPNYGTCFAHFEDIPIHERTPYFNSGFFIANLDAWRSVGVADLSRACIKKYNSRLKRVDQDVLNILFASEIKTLPMCFNLQSSLFFKYYWYFWVRRRQDVKGALHFTTSYKPWLRKCHHPYTRLYRESEFSKSSLRIEPPSVVEISKRIRNTLNALLTTYGKIPPRDVTENIYQTHSSKR